MKIFLIGLPGVGKSTLGKKLAEKLDYNFIDLDHFIEKQACLFVDEIFHLYGEEYFRALEKNALASLDKEDNLIVACGGGIVKNLENKKAMNGLCIYLTAPLDEIDDRLEHSSTDRPLMQTKTLLDLYLERKNLYETFSDFKVENRNMNQALEKILIKLEEYR